METDKVELTPLLIAVAVILGLESAVYLLSAFSMHRLSYLGITRLAEIAGLVQVIRIWGQGLTCVGLAPHRLGPGLKRGMIWSIAFGVVAAAGLGVLQLFGYPSLSIFRMPVPNTLSDVLLFLLIGGLIAPVGEEIFFRGILYGYLRRWGRTVAVVLSTLLFVSAHAATGRFPLTQAVGGLVFALAYEIEDNLMVPITIHVLGNLAIFAMALSL